MAVKSEKCMTVKGSWRLLFSVVDSKEDARHLEFHPEIAIASIVEFKVLRKRILGSTASVNMEIIPSSSSYLLSSTTQIKMLKMSKNLKERCEFCVKCMHEKFF